MELRVHALEAGLGARPGRCSGKSSFHREIEDKTKVRFEVAGDQVVQALERVLGQAAAVALIGQGRIRESVGDHPLATLQGRPDRLHEMGATCRHHQQRLGLRVPALWQSFHQKLADLLGAGRTAGLARPDRPETGLAQAIDQQASLG